MTHEQGLVLACDIDGTLFADEGCTPKEYRASEVALARLCDIVEQKRAADGAPFFFGSATGRTMASHQRHEAFHPSFAAAASKMDFKITSVGAEVHFIKNGRAAALSDWPDAPGWNRRKLLCALEDEPRLTPQPSHAQTEYKISFLVSGKPEYQTYMDKIGLRLAALGLRAEIIYSAGRFLDILPPNVNKGSALVRTANTLARYVRNRGTIPHPAPQGFRTGTAGNSMNDASLLAAASDIAILPGNADADLISWARATLDPAAYYIAARPCADGIIEGLEYFGCIG